MGIITAGILGGFRKKVGNVVGARYKGIDYIRLRVTPTMSQLDGPKLARSNMKDVMALARFNNETILKRTYGNAVKGKPLSPINRFVSRALKGIQPLTEYHKIPWSEGVVTPVQIDNAEYDPVTHMITYDMEGGVSGYGDMSDKCLVFVSNIDDPMAEIVSDGGDRTALYGSCTTNGTGMYKILSSKKTDGAASGKNYLHVVCFNANGEVSETATTKITVLSP